MHYSPLPYGFIRRVLQHLQLTPEDVMADVGCGKGRVLCFAQQYPLRRVIGIEADPDLFNIARKNLALCHGATPVDLVHVLAQDYDYPDITAIVMYCPFDEPTTELFCQRLEESLTREPRHLRIAYANCAYDGVFVRHSWLKRTGEWPGDSVAAFHHTTSFWESRR